MGRGSQAESSSISESRNYFAKWFAVSSFIIMGLVSRLSLANHSDSGSFLMVHTSLSQNGFQQEGFWKVTRTYGLTFHLSFCMYVCSVISDSATSWTSPPGFSVHGIFQVRILEWVAIFYSKWSPQPRCPALADRFFTTKPPGKPLSHFDLSQIILDCGSFLFVYSLPGLQL